MSSISPHTEVGFVKRFAKKGRAYGSYHGFYRFPGEPKQRSINLDVRDKRIAQKKLREIIDHEFAVRAGLVPSDETLERASRPIGEYIDAYVLDLKSRELKPESIRKIGPRLRTLAEECGWTRAIDMTAESFERWRSRRTDLAPKTTNHYLSHARALSEWLKHRGVLERNGLLPVRVARVTGNERRPRRALSFDEIVRLIENCPSEHRKMLYRFAFGTGAREEEILAIRWKHLDLDPDDPTIEIPREISKNKRSTRNPLPLWLAEQLIRFRPENARSNDLVFDRWFHIETFDRDLKRAGIPKIDEHGESAVPYSLRHAMNQVLQEARVPLRIAQELMRHVDVKHTAQTYLDASGLDLRGGVNHLPSPSFDSCTAGCTAERGLQRPSMSDDGQRKTTNPTEESAVGFEKRRLVAGDGQRCPISDFECRRGDSNPQKTAVTGTSSGSCTVGCTVDLHDDLGIVAQAWPRLSIEQREAVLIIVRQSIAVDQSEEDR